MNQEIYQRLVKDVGIRKLYADLYARNKRFVSKLRGDESGGDRSKGCTSISEAGKIFNMAIDSHTPKYNVRAIENI